MSQITTDDVLKVLSPVWQTKAETASRLRGRIERVLEFAKVKDWRSGENPAAWRGKPRWEADRKRRYFEAMRDLADFYRLDIRPYQDMNVVIANRGCYLKEWRKALAEQLLTPSSRCADLGWKKRQLAQLNQWVPATREDVEAAIAADEAFFAAHPTRKAKVMRKDGA